MNRRAFMASLAGAAVAPKAALVPSNWFPIKHVGNSPATMFKITYGAVRPSGGTRLVLPDADPGYVSPLLVKMRKIAAKVGVEE